MKSGTETSALTELLSSRSKGPLASQHFETLYCGRQKRSGGVEVWCKDVTIYTRGQRVAFAARTRPVRLCPVIAAPENRFVWESRRRGLLFFAIVFEVVECRRLAARFGWRVAEATARAGKSWMMTASQIRGFVLSGIELCCTQFVAFNRLTATTTPPKIIEAVRCSES